MHKEKTDIVHAEPPKVEGPLPCAVCGQYDGEQPAVVGKIRAHAVCAAARPDVIAKVKARAG